ncbi:thrombospondin type-1 domain-containing protein 4 [Bemisia tabaci]|uniref:thrombospondin type-1 domain-containing protein 4 n=1 Tax=Bemisia tabaci TaxID=7038 RepID=UPI003B2802E5
MRADTRWLFGFTFGFWLLILLEAEKIVSKIKHHNEVVDRSVWSGWSQWSPCSRVCGGGVVLETRRCFLRHKYSRPDDKSHVKKETSSNCVGPYRRMRLCNNHNCASGTKSFVQEQCEEFNGKPMMGGRVYNWEAFLNAPNQCALNCRAIGFGFYATLKPSVKDGTPCKGPEKDSGRWMCVSGICTHVGCDGIVGSDKQLDSCGVCGGDNNSCKTIAGIFTKPHLPNGYNLITQIPKGACNLTVLKLKPSKNHLALRRLDGTFVVDGNFAFTSLEEIQSSGTKLTLKQDTPDQGEMITSPGPLLEPLELMLVFQQPNSGIKYEYQLKMNGATEVALERGDTSYAYGPADDTSSHEKNIGNSYSDNAAKSEGTLDDEATKSEGKRRKKKFYWKISGFSECSMSCAGGVQTAINVCVRESNSMTAPDKRCTGLELPQPQTQRCNVKPCPAEWEAGEWGDCSASCGEGVRRRKLVCRQRITASLTMTVSDGACLSSPSRNFTLEQPCALFPCPIHSAKAEDTEPRIKASWRTEPWSKCSTQCGLGIRTRTVVCQAVNGQQCLQSTRPQNQEVCDMGPCSSETPSWFIAEWSQKCSVECGVGVQTRKVLCSAGLGKDSQCDISSKPETSRTCSSDKSCDGQWFAGPWSECSETCGWGVQTRRIACLAYQRGEFSIAKDSSCSNSSRPTKEQSCREKPCSPQWYTADWMPCSQSCGTGVQRRELHCLDEKGKVSSDCLEDLKPSSRRSCSTHSCPPDKSSLVKLNETSLPTLNDKMSSLGDQAFNTVDNSLEQTEDCRNLFRNCYLVVQARLCKYKYYRSSCCLACKGKT